MCLLRRYPPPIYLSHRFFYRHGSTTSLVVRHKTGPGANPAHYSKIRDFLGPALYPVCAFYGHVRLDSGKTFMGCWEI